MLTFIIIYLVLTVRLLPPLTALAPPAVLTVAGPEPPLALPAVPVSSTALPSLAAALQRAVPAVPSLLTDAGAVDTLAVLLTARVAELEVTERPPPALVAVTGSPHTGAVAATGEAAHTEAAVRPGPVSGAPALPAAQVEGPVVVAVRQAGLDQEVPLVAGLAHPAEVAVADTLGTGPVLGTAPVQAVSCTEEQTSVNNHNERIN